MNYDVFKAQCLRRDSQQRRPLIMGILNVTPDSFSDGGRYVQLEEALKQARKMIAEGADILDIGGESSRPGAEALSQQEELDRVLPVIEAIRKESDIMLSIDTYKPEVMWLAIKAGVEMVNDIKALTQEGSLDVVAKTGVPVCLMHMKGQPKTMQLAPTYSVDLMDELKEFFQERINACLNAGIQKEQLILDPGFGFGKTVEHNLLLVKRLNELLTFDLPLLLGVSRKTTLGALIDKPVSERLIPGIALTVAAQLQGAQIFRTHDVAETLQAAQTIAALMR